MCQAPYENAPVEIISRIPIQDRDKKHHQQARLVPSNSYAGKPSKEDHESMNLPQNSLSAASSILQSNRPRSRTNLSAGQKHVRFNQEGEMYRTFLYHVPSNYNPKELFYQPEEYEVFRKDAIKAMMLRKRMQQEYARRHEQTCVQRLVRTGTKLLQQIYL